MDQHLTLTAETLALSEEVQAGATIDGVLVLKYLPRGTYLHLTAAEYRILRYFERGEKVPTCCGN